MNIKIIKHTDPESGVSFRNIPKKCSQCHGNKEIIDKYRLPENRVRTYLDSYHGVANWYGDKRVATCASCHGYHNILPVSNPLSSVNPKNLIKTCAKCHPGADRRFGVGIVHTEPTPESNLGMYIVRKFYLWFTGVLAVLFIIHIIFDAVKARGKKAK